MSERRKRDLGTPDETRERGFLFSHTIPSLEERQATTKVTIIIVFAFPL